MENILPVVSFLVGINSVLWSVDTDFEFPGKCIAPLKVVAELSSTQKKYLETITASYTVSPILVQDVIRYVDKHAHHVFPKREDLLAIIGIESSWNPKAKSPLKVDPAVGLTQIRPVTNKKFIPDPKSLNSVENQVKYAVKILNYHFQLTKSREGAIMSYNVGYGNWLDGKYDISYFVKFSSERDKFKRS